MGDSEKLIAGIPIVEKNEDSQFRTALLIFFLASVIRTRLGTL